MSEFAEEIVLAIDVLRLNAEYGSAGVPRELTEAANQIILAALERSPLAESKKHANPS